MYDMQVVTDEYVRHHFTSTLGPTAVNRSEDLVIFAIVPEDWSVEPVIFDLKWTIVDVVTPPIKEL